MGKKRLTMLTMYNSNMLRRQHEAAQNVERGEERKKKVIFACFPL